MQDSKKIKQNKAKKRHEIKNTQYIQKHTIVTQNHKMLKKKTKKMKRRHWKTNTR